MLGFFVVKSVQSWKSSRTKNPFATKDEAKSVGWVRGKQGCWRLRKIYDEHVFCNIKHFPYLSSEDGRFFLDVKKRGKWSWASSSSSTIDSNLCDGGGGRPRRRRFRCHVTLDLAAKFDNVSSWGKNTNNAYWSHFLRRIKVILENSPFLADFSPSFR